MNRPSTSQSKRKPKRERHKQVHRRTSQSLIYALIILIVIALLISALLFPVLRVCGESMTPTLNNNEFVILVKTQDFKVGDLCCFTWNSKTLIKRVIALSGDLVEIDKDGAVYVNEQPLDEPYVTDKSLSECDITFPYKVPENSFFVLGDNRKTSIDSRSSVIGNVSKDKIIGKVWFRIFPFNRINIIK